jgi:hypothetical protein
MQKSQQGLLRALIFEVLNQQPDLIPVVLPLLWARTYDSLILNKIGLVNFSWTLRELKESFLRLIAQKIVPIKICFLIDGLGEFDGDHEEISELFKYICTADRVKACVSSRPWVVFEEAFRDCAKLRLQDLTRNDIQQYVSGTLASNGPFQKLSTKDPVLATTFVQEIVETAEGVFLWVMLVVRSLSNGIRNRDDIPDLQKRLRQLPRELEPLYDRLLALTKPEYFQSASKTFRILRQIEQDDQNKFECFKSTNIPYFRFVEELALSILGLYLALQGGLDFETVKGWTRSKVLSKCEDTEVQLTARCGGLLEVTHAKTSIPGLRMSSSSRVRYLHETARVYLLKPEVWNRIVSSIPEDVFDVDVSLVNSYVYQMGASLPKDEIPSYDYYKVLALRALFHANRAEIRGSPAPDRCWTTLNQSCVYCTTLIPRIN